MELLPPELTENILNSASPVELINYCSSSRGTNNYCEQYVWLPKLSQLKLYDESKMPVAYPGQNNGKPEVSAKAYFIYALVIFDVDKEISPKFVLPAYMVFNSIKLGYKDVFDQLIDSIDKYSFDYFAVTFFVIRYRRWGWIDLEPEIKLQLESAYETFFSDPISQDDMDNFKKYVGDSKNTGQVLFYTPATIDNLKRWEGYVLPQDPTKPDLSYQITEYIAKNNIPEAIKLLKKWSGTYTLDDLVSRYLEYVTVPFVKALLDNKLVYINSVTEYIVRFNLWYLFEIEGLPERVRQEIIRHEKSGSRNFQVSPIARKMISLEF